MDVANDSRQLSHAPKSLREGGEKHRRGRRDYQPSRRAPCAARIWSLARKATAAAASPLLPLPNDSLHRLEVGQIALNPQAVRDGQSTAS